MKITNIIAAIIIILAIVILPVIGLYGDWLWFLSLNYGSVFWTVLSTKIFLGLITGVIFLVVLLINTRVIKSFIKKKSSKKNISLKPMIILIVILSLLIGSGFSSGWDTYLKFSNSSEFGITDPVFSHDISFYTFTLPFYEFILSFATVLVIFSLIITFGAYIIYSGGGSRKIEMKLKSSSGENYEPIIEEKKTKTKTELTKHMRAHISFLAGILFLLIGVGFYLARFSVLFSSTGTVFGAGYTDINIILTALTIMTVVSVIVGITFFISTKTKKNYAKYGVIALVVIGIVGIAASGVVQSFIVSPNEFNLEKPYIQRNIDYTLKAYDLENVNEKQFPVSYELSKEDVENNEATINNVRLIDWRPLLKTNRQVQVFRTYYDFKDVDIDRYKINGEYKEVMITSRELNQRNLASNARTWVNRHLVYTHGYGLTMSPVDTSSDEGLPIFYVKDIPPKSDYIDITRPEIYFGEQTDEFIITKTTTEELDYPQGDTNIYTTYEGSLGIKLTPLTKLIYAIRFGSIELLVSGSLTDESEIIFNRNIHKRVNELAPFLAYDSDPYIIVSNGKLYWIYDAYTVTGQYPYSEPLQNGINYIRNSVKVVIDAYDGTTKFYVINNSDPMIQTYRKIFPSLFTDFEEMDEDIKAHIRYPEDLFRVQAGIYSIYHMKDPRVFYNREDIWNIPNEVYRNIKQEIDPYYIIMRLPDETKEEFILMMPFTPRNKDNMIGWMAAKSDFPNYGEKIVFAFSKQELIYGPLQIEARIDQDTEISQLITLWNQGGSDVIRGNLLVIPIESSVLYVEPLYLQASETGLPQLKRVIVALGNKIAMEETFEQALEKVLGEDITINDDVTGESLAQLISRANNLYEEAERLLRNGDLAGYAQKIEQLGSVLQELNTR